MQVTGTFPALSEKLSPGKPKKAKKKNPMNVAGLKKLGPLANKALRGGGC